MTDTPTDRGAALWNERFSERYAAYGTEPNAFLSAVAGRIPDGPVLVMAAGEGRNAVHLAQLGHDVTAVDLSEVGLAHAAELAGERGVALHTVVADLAEFDPGEAAWAGIVTIWAHVPPPVRARVHAAVPLALRPGGAFVAEAYHPRHLDMPGIGGPPVADLMVTADAARRELDGLEFELCQEVDRHIAEGRLHQGLSATTQVLARRPR